MRTTDFTGTLRRPQEFAAAREAVIRGILDLSEADPALVRAFPVIVDALHIAEQIAQHEWETAE